MQRSRLNTIKTIKLLELNKGTKIQSELRENLVRQRLKKEKAAALKLQSTAKVYLKKKETLANQWVKNQLNIQKSTATELMFYIANKETIIPTSLSLHLVLNSLFKNKAQINAKDKYKMTTLHIASLNGDLELAQILIKNGADLNPENTVKPLNIAIKKGNLEVAQLLIENGADVDAKWIDGCTCLHIATIRGNLKLAKILIEHGADVNTEENNGRTPLYWASEQGNLDLAKILIEHGANVDSDIIMTFKNNHSFKDIIIKRITELNPQKLNLIELLRNRELNKVDGQNIAKLFNLKRAVHQLWPTII